MNLLKLRSTGFRARLHFGPREHEYADGLVMGPSSMLLVARAVALIYRHRSRSTNSSYAVTSRFRM